MKDVSRRVKKVVRGRLTLEGAGVKLRRVFGFREVPAFDPFLMLDDFGSANPDDYIAGFPWHPHRGIETVTYMLQGTVAHGDSLGHAGVIGPGQVQWMTAGGGIVHQEMPERQPDRLRGLQLWVNLPKKAKMIAPRYRSIAAEDIPEHAGPDRVLVKVIAGCYEGLEGPVRDVVVDPEYLDVQVPAGIGFGRDIPRDRSVFAYVVEGKGIFDAEGREAARGEAVLFGGGPAVSVRAGEDGIRFILVSGRPLREPIAWRGPIVMNTEEELVRAFAEYEAGTFVRRP